MDRAIFKPMTEIPPLTRIEREELEKEGIMRRFHPDIGWITVSYDGKIDRLVHASNHKAVVYTSDYPQAREKTYHSVVSFLKRQWMHKFLPIYRITRTKKTSSSLEEQASEDSHQQNKV